MSDATASDGLSGNTSFGGQPAERVQQPDVSESAFLGQEADAAKAAVVESLRNLQNDLKAATDLRSWAREHPWLAVGIASLAGFAAAAAVRTAGENASPPNADGRQSPAAPDFAEHGASVRPATASTLASAFSWLVAPLLDVLKTALEKFLASVSLPSDGSGVVCDEAASPSDASTPKR